jgi:hypothetical protein
VKDGKKGINKAKIKKEGNNGRSKGGQTERNK